MLLYEFLDDLLDDDEKLTVESHLSACPACRKKLAEIKLLYYELDNLDDIELPEEVNAIRSDVVQSAFNDQKISAAEKIRRTKKVIEETPVVGALIPNKENAKKVAKGLLTGSKKLYQKLPKKAPKTSKPKTKKSLGGLL